MWVMVMFDLPVGTTDQRRVYAKFRKWLMEDGFIQLQYSVYARPCPSEENAVVHCERVRKKVPREGQVRVLRFTDKQFGRMEVYFGKIERAAEKQPEQLTFF